MANETLTSVTLHEMFTHLLLGYLTSYTTLPGLYNIQRYHTLLIYIKYLSKLLFNLAATEA